jgi:hypothetical protein
VSFAERCAKLPTPARRIVALFGMPLAIALLGAVLWMPISYIGTSQAEWREDAIETLAAARRAPQIQAALNQQVERMRASPLWSKFYRMPNAAAASTALHSDLSALLTNAGASVQSLTPIPSEDQPVFTRIGVRATASLRLDDLRNLLTAMSAHARYLRVDRLVVTAPQVQMDSENPALAVTLDVFGYQLVRTNGAR